VLDLGTGGGERLADLRPSLPRLVVATEEWSRNAPVAFRRLRPLGIAVIRCRSDRLPLLDSTFDLVIDRHEEFSPQEVSRVLNGDGEFITQQVGQSDWHELRPFFPRMTDFGDLRLRYAREFERMGFRVESAEYEYRVAYPSLGEIVFMLGVAPWTVPEFDLTKDLDSLLAFEARSSTPEGLVLTESRFLLTAHKPSEASD
jgi:SAM-dependent methyltransferase